MVSLDHCPDIEESPGLMLNNSDNNSDNNSNNNNNINNKKENLITMFKFLVQDEPETCRASLVSPEQCLNVEHLFEYPK